MKLQISFGKRNFVMSFGKQEAPAPNPFARSYAAASIDRLTADWCSAQSSADAEIETAHKTIRGRARQGERDNEFVEGYLQLLENNILGADGVRLQMKVTNADGSSDTNTNRIITDAWYDWGKRRYCTASGKYCWREVEGISLRRAACDGGILLMRLRGWDNEYKYTVQPLEMDHLDTDFNAALSNGNEVRFGVEFDSWRKPVAFYLFKKHPGDFRNAGNQRTRISANDLIHIYWSQRPNQTIGVSWLAPVLLSLEHLGKYREAELIASRIHACQGIAIENEKTPNSEYQTDASGRQIQEMSPGMIANLDPGQKLVNIDPTHPNTAFGEFNKSALRGIARGLGVNYNSIANDLESVNYSSMRAGKLEECEEYKNVQGWFIESLHEIIFEDWLEMALIAGAIPFKPSDFERLNKPDWKPRRWPWVDPLKDIQAAVLAINNKLKSRRAIIAEMGGDIEEVFAELKADNELADENELTLEEQPEPKQQPDDAAPRFIVGGMDVHPPIDSRPELNGKNH